MAYDSPKAAHFDLLSDGVRLTHRAAAHHPRAEQLLAFRWKAAREVEATVTRDFLSLKPEQIPAIEEIVNRINSAMKHIEPGYSIRFRKPKY